VCVCFCLVIICVYENYATLIYLVDLNLFLIYSLIYLVVVETSVFDPITDMWTDITPVYWPDNTTNVPSDTFPYEVIYISERMLLLVMRILNNMRGHS
jgi:hypothetical protein